jgi:pimeloyl-ACP methyl ester carboxylesterase
MNRATSRDGTSIAYDRGGSGPPVVLIGGTLTSRAAGMGNNAALAAELTTHFTVYNYDRRGRGDSGGTTQDPTGREIDDLEAVIAAAGGSAHLYGVSSGGALALEAAAAGVAADKIAVYEVPYRAPGDTQRWLSYRKELDALLAADRPGDALELFHRHLGIPDEHIAAARQSPLWPEAVALAHTLAQDAALLGNGALPVARLAHVNQPVLVATGGGFDLIEQTADAIAATVPHATRLTLQGLEHAADAKALVPELQRFYSD